MAEMTPTPYLDRCNDPGSSAAVRPCSECLSVATVCVADYGNVGGRRADVSQMKYECSRNAIITDMPVIYVRAEE